MLDENSRVIRKICISVRGWNSAPWLVRKLLCKIKHYVYQLIYQHQKNIHHTTTPKGLSLLTSDLSGSKFQVPSIHTHRVHSSKRNGAHRSISRASITSLHCSIYAQRARQRQRRLLQVLGALMCLFIRAPSWYNVLLLLCLLCDMLWRYIPKQKEPARK